jgi:hypothetical protein
MYQPIGGASHETDAPPAGYIQEGKVCKYYRSKYLHADPTKLGFSLNSYFIFNLRAYFAPKKLYSTENP